MIIHAGYHTGYNLMPGCYDLCLISHKDDWNKLSLLSDCKIKVILKSFIISCIMYMHSNSADVNMYLPSASSIHEC
jgi:hypothetical protein